MDKLCSVESDKASVELTSPFTGVVLCALAQRVRCCCELLCTQVSKLHWKASDTVKVTESFVKEGQKIKVKSSAHCKYVINGSAIYVALV
eukprot:3006160-Amphidinium_carterae.1